MKYKLKWWHLIIIFVLILFFISSDKLDKMDDSTNAPDEFLFWNNKGATEIFPKNKIIETKPIQPSFFALYSASDIIAPGETQEISFLTYSNYICWDTKAQYRIFRPDGTDDAYFSNEGIISNGDYIFINFYYSNTGAEGAYDGWSWLTCEDDVDYFKNMNGGCPTGSGCENYAPGFIIGGIDYDYPLFTVETQSDPCDPQHYEEKCYDGQLWWYDACNHRNDLSDDCGTGMCPPGATSCDDCQPLEDHQGCSVDGDAAWFDSCNRLQSIIDDCGPNEQCQLTSKDVQITGVATCECACGGDTPICMGDECVECATDDDCGEFEECSTSLTCEPTGACNNDENCDTGYICINSECVIGCRDDSECQTGEICENGQCTDIGCSSNNDCGNSQICQAGECVDVNCVNDGDCIGLEICVDYTCETVECISDGNCDEGEYCTADNMCQISVDCTNDSDCGDLELCVDNVCSTVECKTADDCNSGDECNDNICQTPCTENSNCESLEECTDGYCIEIDCIRDMDCAEHPSCTDVVCICEENVCIPAFNGGGGGGGSSTFDKDDDEIDWEKIAAEQEAAEKAKKQKQMLYLLATGIIGYVIFQKTKKNGKKKRKTK